MQKDEHKDPFEYRSHGGSFKVGLEEGDNVSCLVKMDNRLLVITRKNISKVLMADEVDPEKTNPNIDHNIQFELPVGSDSRLVGATFQQASVLFKEHSLAEGIDTEKGISIAFLFLKEITALDKLMNEYILERDAINNQIAKNTGSKSHVPSLPNLEQKVKSFLINFDHTMKFVIELVQLFYPEIKNKGWIDSLFQKINTTAELKMGFAPFVDSIKGFIQMSRNIRNVIEHPQGVEVGVLTLKNYVLTPKNTLTQPSISYDLNGHGISETEIGKYMNVCISNILTIFETLMAYLCNFHAVEFGNVRRVVIEILERDRSEGDKNVRFGYSFIPKGQE